MKHRTHFGIRIGLVVVFGLGVGIAGCGNSGSSSTSSVDTSEVSQGAGFANLLKGMNVAVDSDGNRAFVAGIMTDSVGIVDLGTDTLVDAFTVDDHSPTTKKMIYDATHGKLWMASGKGERLWIVDPESREALEIQDISGDTSPDANSYPVRGIALDPVRERLYVARSDGFPGGRVAVYDSSLEKMGDILKGISVQEMEWDGERDALVALTAPKNSQGEIRILPAGDESLGTSLPAPFETGQPPALLAIEPAGAFFVAGKNLWKIAEDGTVEWKSPLPASASALQASGEEVAVLYQTGLLSEADLYLSRLETYATGSGNFLVRRKCRFEASRMAVNRETGEFVVGNGGDSSITILPAGSGEGTSVRVGSAAEDVLLAPDGERLLILNRLGGSELIERNLLTGESRVVEAGSWPMRMAMQESEDRLYVMNHFETKLTILRLSDLELLGSMALGLPSCTGDSIAEMAFNEEGTLLASLVCELGKVVVIDPVQQKILNTVTLADPDDSYGPGRFQGAVDGDNQRIFVFVSKEKLVYRLDGGLDYEIGKTAVAKPGSDASGYALSGVFYSRELNLLFVNDLVLHPNTLKTITSLEGVCRVVAEEPGMIYAQHRASNGDETLVRIDSGTLETVSTEALPSTEKMASYITFDFKNRKYAVANPAKAEAHVYDLD